MGNECSSVTVPSRSAGQQVDGGYYQRGADGKPEWVSPDGKVGSPNGGGTLNTRDHSPGPAGQHDHDDMFHNLLEDLHIVRCGGHGDTTTGRPQDTSKWSAEQWMDAIKENPSKYASLYAKASARNELSENAKENKNVINLTAQEELASYKQGIEMQSTLMASLNDLQKSIIGNIRG